MPLHDKQYKALLGAIPKALDHKGPGRRMRAVAQLMRHSGLAIGDAVTLKRDSLVFDKKFTTSLTIRSGAKNTLWKREKCTTR